MKANLPFKYIITVKNGKQYVVFDYRDGDGKRKWVTTGLPEKCAKKALNDKVEEIVAEFYENYLKGNVTKTNKPASNIPQVNSQKSHRFIQKPHGRVSSRRHWRSITLNYLGMSFTEPLMALFVVTIPVNLLHPITLLIISNL